MDHVSCIRIRTASEKISKIKSASAKISKTHPPIIYFKRITLVGECANSVTQIETEVELKQQRY